MCGLDILGWYLVDIMCMKEGIGFYVFVFMFM